MNKKTLGTVAIVVVVLLALFMVSKNKGSDQAMLGEHESTPTKDNPITQEQSMKGLLASNTSQECIFSDPTAQAPFSGKVFVGNGKMRGDFSTTINGQTNVSHMISDSATGYMWTDGQKSGYKMDLSATAVPNQQPSTPVQSVDQNKNYAFNCQSWSFDESKFSLPGDIEFQDLSAMMKKMAPEGTMSPKSGTSGSVDMQAACNSLPEPAKTQCLNAIK